MKKNNETSKLIKQFAYLLPIIFGLLSLTVNAQTSEQLSGTIIGTDGSWGGDADRTKEAAMDGDVSTFFDSPDANGSWVGLSMSDAATITSIRFYPRDGKERRMNGGKFQGSSTADFSSDVTTLYTISSTPPAAYTEVDISNTSSFQYVRYLSPDNSYGNIAELEFYGYSGDSEAPTTPENLNASAISETSFTLSWNASSDNVDVEGYEVFQDGSSLGTTASTSMDITGLSCGTTYSMTVKAYDAAGNVSNSSSTLSVTTSACSEEGLLSGTIIGTSGSWGGDADRTKEAAMDGDVSTFFDSPDASGSWVGLSMSDAATITSVRFYPRSGKASRMNGGKFQGSSTADFSSDVTTLYTISSTPPEAYTEVEISNSSSFKYVRYLSPDNSYGNVAEIEFYGTGGGGGGTVDDTEAPTEPTNLSASSIGQTSFTLSWDASTDNVGVESYEVFKDGSSVGTTSNTNLSITGLSCETSYSMTVKAYDAAGNVSNSSSTLSVTTSACSEEGLLSGTIIGTSGSWGGDADRTKEAAMDGDVSTFFDSPDASGSWVGLSMSDAATITSVRFYPRSGKASRMNGGKFQGSSTADFSSDVTTLYTISSTPPEAYTEVVISNSSSFKYVRYLSPDNSYGNVAEIEFYGTGGGGGGTVDDTEAPTEPTNLSASSIGQTSFTLSWDASADNVGVDSYEVFKDGSSVGTTSNTSMNITGLSCENTYSMTVKAKDAAGNVSAASNALSVTTSNCGGGTDPDWHDVGIGLDGINYYSSYSAFNDVIKHVKWIDVASWNSNGYPASANPDTKAQARAGISNGLTWPAGNYVLTWEGDGDVTLISGNAVEIESERDLTSNTKRRVYEWTPDEKGHRIQVNSYPVDNIHLYLPGQEENPSLWNPEYVAYMEPFRGTHFRFMDMNATNGSDQENWSDRTPRNWSSYTNTNNDNCAPWDIKGKVSYEAMIELCNELDADMWLCIPHMATDDYVTKLAHLIKTGVDLATGEQATDPLRSDLRVWLEYSNEVWNWGFAQSNWVLDNISGENLDVKYATKAVDVFDVFENSFTDPDRVIRVLATQFGWSGGMRTRQRIEAVPRESFDAMALTTYFDADFKQYIYENWPLTVGQGINYLDNQVGSGVFKEDDNNSEAVDLYWTYYYTKKYDVPMIAYEGNDHVNPVGKVDTDGDGKKDSPLNGKIPEATDYIHSVMRNPGIQGVYEKWLQRHHESGLITNTPFVLLGHWSEYGQWGHVEYVGQTVDEAPKYKALLDFYNLSYPILKSAQMKQKSIAANNDMLNVSASIFPNPVYGTSFTVKLENSQNNTLTIYSLEGKILKQKEFNTTQEVINISDLKKGLYIVDINGTSKKLIIR